MKVLFLDVDGVLNKKDTEEKLETHVGPMTATDPVLVKRFLDWYDKHPEVQIVLSSSWRIDPERWGYVFTGHLHDVGIKWISETPNLGHRGKDIAAWLDENDATHWAILDDTSNVHPVGAGLVQTSERWGLEDKHLKKLNALLELEDGL